MDVIKNRLLEDGVEKSELQQFEKSIEEGVKEIVNKFDIEYTDSQLSNLVKVIQTAYYEDIDYVSTELDESMKSLFYKYKSDFDNENITGINIMLGKATTMKDKWWFKDKETIRFMYTVSGAILEDNYNR